MNGAHGRADTARTTVGTVDTDDVFRRTAANRRRAADLLAGLSPEQWLTPSLCAGWTI